MAAMHIDDMLGAQKQGPYILAGQSLGGMTALEVALQASSHLVHPASGHWRHMLAAHGLWTVADTR